MENEKFYFTNLGPATPLRYGENPHQNGECYGDSNNVFKKLHGKELSYNNLGDIDAAVGLMNDIKGETAFAIIKHANSCGFAIRPTLLESWKYALAADQESAFGGIFITNTHVDVVTATEINEIFYEVI
ncbi:bifunctional phosphoribosylaminoimidazolecarboxamide formyltransferase/IMP cyclohydrolase PurH, partial [Patescibacteria group bacterium]|nr:bifunctional phosphoribosylaminoimidazolecarboxamide formyltransferase/IMP cyclohydrolase PurH [Patescibacteria group bacterium]